MKIQVKASSEFTTLSQALEEKVNAMTTLVERLGKDIVGGLAAVSNSGQQIQNLNERYIGISESVEKVAKRLQEVVKQMSTANDGGVAAHDELRKTNELLEKINARTRRVGG